LGGANRSLVAEPTYDDEMAKPSINIQGLALLGARQRLRELDEERAAIFRAFPQLRSASSAGAGSKASNKEESNGRPEARARKRRRMSADARRRISEAMKARWAKQRAGEAKKRGQAAPTR
jgi:hypothetical protein